MSSGNSSGGLGILDVVLIVNIILKLCNVITWSWIWVLAPFWVGIIISLVSLFALVHLKLK